MVRLKKIILVFENLFSGFCIGFIFCNLIFKKLAKRAEGECWGGEVPFQLGELVSVWDGLGRAFFSIGWGGLGAG